MQTPGHSVTHLSVSPDDMWLAVCSGNDIIVLSIEVSHLILAVFSNELAREFIPTLPQLSTTIPTLPQLSTTVSALL